MDKFQNGSFCIIIMSHIYRNYYQINLLIGEVQVFENY